MESVRSVFANPLVRKLRRSILASATVVSVAVLLMLAAATLPTLVGFDSFVVIGGSMGNTVRPGSIVVAQRVDPATLQVGDIVTFRRPQNPDLPITHRVVGIREEDGVTRLQTKGDANATSDVDEFSATLPISKLVYTVPWVGYIVAFARTAAGKLLLIALPLLILLARGLASPLSPPRRGDVPEEGPPSTAPLPFERPGEAPAEIQGTEPPRRLVQLLQAPQPEQLPLAVGAEAYSVLADPLGDAPLQLISLPAAAERPQEPPPPAGVVLQFPETAERETSGVASAPAERSTASADVAPPASAHAEAPGHDDLSLSATTTRGQLRAYRVAPPRDRRHRLAGLSAGMLIVAVAAAAWGWRTVAARSR